MQLISFWCVSALELCIKVQSDMSGCKSARLNIAAEGKKSKGHFERGELVTRATFDNVKCTLPWLRLHGVQLWQLQHNGWSLTIKWKNRVQTIQETQPSWDKKHRTGCKLQPTPDGTIQQCSRAHKYWYFAYSVRGSISIPRNSGPHGPVNRLCRDWWVLSYVDPPHVFFFLFIFVKKKSLLLIVVHLKWKAVLLWRKKVTSRFFLTGSCAEPYVAFQLTGNIHIVGDSSTASVVWGF